VEAEQVAEILGGRQTMGVAVTSRLDLARAVRAGLRVGVLSWLIDNKVLTLLEVEHIIPRRTIAYRKRHGATLSPSESDRLARVARIVALAEETMQSKEKAARWLRLANRGLGGDRPLDLLDTDEGARLVETILTRLAHGVYS
jgi:putative toxin-antitoxin system antitoxin component (TIGR02293 family)